MVRVAAGTRMAGRVAVIVAAALALFAAPAAADGADAASSGVHAAIAVMPVDALRAPEHAGTRPFQAAAAARGSFDMAASDVETAPATRVQQAARNRRTTARRGIGVHGFVLYESTAMIASQSFDAVLGSSTLSGTGGGVEVLRLWRGLFARVVGSTARGEGSRVIAAGGDPESVDIPTTVEVSPLVIGAGWRVPVGRTGRVVPYGGGGFMRLSYRETSRFATSGETTDEAFRGYTIFGGVDVGIWKVLSAGVEVEVRHAPRAIGKAGLSQVFDERDLGGSAIRVLVGVRY
jgi:hypothetical protein